MIRGFVGFVLVMFVFAAACGSVAKLYQRQVKCVPEEWYKRYPQHLDDGIVTIDEVYGRSTHDDEVQEAEVRDPSDLKDSE